MITMRFLLSALLSMMAFSGVAEGRFCVDPARSKFEIHTGTSGLFGALGHDHSIVAKDIQGCAEIDWTHVENSSVSLTFSTAGITVLDPKHPKDQPEVQKTMEDQVLRVKEFPDIRFKSDRVRVVRKGTSRSDLYDLIVDGPLTIRGHTEPVSIRLMLDRGGPTEAKVTGKHTLKQSTFGIKPVSLVGGTVKVKDEIELVFELLLQEK